MADELPGVDAQQLASVLLEARMRLDEVVAHLRSPGDQPLRLRPALEDNNSGCNTACACRAVAEQVMRPSA